MFTRLCKKCFYIPRIFLVNINILWDKIFTLLNAKQAIGLFNRVKRDAIQLVRSIYRANKAKDKRAYLEVFFNNENCFWDTLYLERKDRMTITTEMLTRNIAKSCVVLNWSGFTPFQLHLSLIANISQSASCHIAKPAEIYTHFSTNNLQNIKSPFDNL